MRISQWARWIELHPALQTLSEHSTGGLTFPSIASEARPFVASGIVRRAPGKCIIVAPTYDRVLQWQAKLALCGINEALIRILPSGQSTLFEDSLPESVALSDRIGALRFLTEPGPGVIITTPPAALERTLPREILEESFFSLRKGDTIDENGLVRRLQMLGYEKSEPVRMPGQYSRRGGIIDIYVAGAQNPVRIELFGDEVDSLRSFDPISQRSIAPVSVVALAPSRETLYAIGEDGADEDDLARARQEFVEMISNAAAQEAALLPDEAGAKLEAQIEDDVKALGAGVFFDRLDLYRPYLHADSNCLLDLLPEDGWLILDEPLELAAFAARAEEELGTVLQSRMQRGEILQCTLSDFMLPPEHLDSHERVIHFIGMGGLPDWMSPGHEVDLEFISMEPYRARLDTLPQRLKDWHEQGFMVIIATDQPTRARSVLHSLEIFPVEDLADGTTPEPNVYLVQGNLAGGFLNPSEKIAVLTDRELFGVGRLKLPQRRFNEGAAIATVLDLKPGDYVVHINYGIGIFRGLESRTVAGITKEVLYIQYGGPDKLYVPADQLDRIQKYLNPGDTEPKLNRLHSGEWQRAVGKAREEAREFARDLIRLYAQRKRVERPSYGPDSPWQAEMETTFPWVETAGQMKAIQETKLDLTQPYPMDRLICGDVGFGKTEVAIRAAFKVAQAGRQVAVLCPTTILSEQHFRNFAERLGPFPTRLDYLNRFRSTAERREILKKVEAGEIDIIIGTHALLSQELKFKDLGMVVIDEEQKFGVKQKESLKKLRVSVDVLSMSATPIPRTLSMALMDIRQMSLINDPPPGRLPIRTIVRPFQKELVRDALMRELARGGQVFYVSNRVTGLYHIAEKVRQMVPQARIAVGHGQMSEQELEPVMLAFMKGEIDILISTTIVEAGLDIPNANTLIVENADRFGLSQLYQLRGRVGRSDRQAYAYLLYSSERELTENAHARLQSLQEFSTLGSGYSLAFRDLQIRGAGDLLGAKQSGTMATVGYELFMQIIAEEVTFLKSHADGERRDYNDPLEGLAPLPTLDLPVSAMIPPGYIPDQAQRLYYYKQLMSSRNVAELDEVATEIADRYGSSPIEVQRAVEIMRLRMRCRELAIEKIEGDQGRLAIYFRPDAEISSRVFSIMQKRNREFYVAREKGIWPFGKDPLVAARTMLDTYAAAIDEIEAQRAAFT
ncbi:MAG: transcription-repair coupling factor [Chthonomonas sp.]|nr:transcription-repair coupling factor [Chthonomonas sp.]